MVHSQCCHHRLKTMGTFILVDLSHHRKPKTISHPHTLLQIAFSCQTFEISLWIPLLPPLLTPTPEAFWLGPLEVTVICKISYILNLFWNVLFFSLYPLWWYVYSCLLPITVEFGEFFYIFWLWVICRIYVLKNFFSVHGLSLHHLNLNEFQLITLFSNERIISSWIFCHKLIEIHLHIINFHTLVFLVLIFRILLCGEVGAYWARTLCSSARFISLRSVNLLRNWTNPRSLLVDIVDPWVAQTFYISL